MDGSTWANKLPEFFETGQNAPGGFQLPLGSVPLQAGLSWDEALPAERAVCNDRCLRKPARRNRGLAVIARPLKVSERNAVGRCVASSCIIIAQEMRGADGKGGGGPVMLPEP
jgi:hypothetical protein